MGRMFADGHCVFFADRGYTLSFKSPKEDDLSLFELGERAYDHLLILPLKAKGALRLI